MGASGGRQGRALACLAIALTVLAVCPAAFADGSFKSSDTLLNQVWQVSVQTATDMVVPGPLTTDAMGNACVVNLPVVILDGVVRDRCVFVGDLSVTGLTLEVSTPSDIPVVRSMLAFFAGAQLPNGAIPAAAENIQSVLFDYNAYWVIGVYNYVLYSGDVAFARQVWPNLVKLMDGWYPSQEQADGLVVNSGGLLDYSYFPTSQPLVAYFNGGYAVALQDAAALAQWVGQPSAASRWRARAQALVAPFSRTFWDSSAGAFLDSPTGDPVHPQDGNAFAILGGLATPAQAKSVLVFLSHANGRNYGNTIADDNVWDNATMSTTQAKNVVYPFMSYYEVLARYKAGSPSSALDLIRREWGYMVTKNLVLDNPHQGMWELIGPYGGAPPLVKPSWEHGWSSGAAPALTNYVLGVKPASPGFATFTVNPRPGNLTWASGTVPTPHGNITVSWKRVAGKLKLSVHSPAGEKWVR